MKYNVLKQSELFERISHLVPTITDKHPPLTLILGSGFSYGIIPTTYQIVREDLPWWKWCQRQEADGPTPEDYLKGHEQAFADKAKAVSKNFWKRIHDGQPASAESFTLDVEGLPASDKIGEAYRYALSSNCTHGLNTPREVRRYFGDIIRRAGRRLNPAHLYLASIIADNPRLFGTIFTTNFDPLLQRSLQLVNAPYFVSDRPETLQYPDDDDVADAIHIIHAHGSIYRYLLLNSRKEIERYADTNQTKLQEYFRKHAVLIVGFSGWDDAITRALKSVAQFDLSLYWCDRSTDPDESSLTNNAREILNSHANAFYVPITGADDLMVQLHQHISGHGLPRIFREPILSARDQLDLCNLNGFMLEPPHMRTMQDFTRHDNKIGESGTGGFDLGVAIASVRKQLDDAQSFFTGIKTIDEIDMLATQVRHRLSIVSDLVTAGKHVDAIPYLEYIVKNLNLLDNDDDKAYALYIRGICYRVRGHENDLDLAICDYTSVVEQHNIKIAPKTMALVNRGVAYRLRQQAEDLEKAIADYTTVVEMTDVPIEPRAKARYNRALAYEKRADEGDLERAIADFSAVVAMPNTPEDILDFARYFRALGLLQKDTNGNLDHAMTDFSAIIESQNAPLDIRIMALIARGAEYSNGDRIEDKDFAILDFTKAILLSPVNSESTATAFCNRGIAYRQRGKIGDSELAISDFTSVVNMHIATVEQRTKAYFNRGLIYDQGASADDATRAIRDYSFIIESNGDTSVPLENVYCNRGIAYKRRNTDNDLDLAVADLTKAIDMLSASSELRDSALFNRASLYHDRNNSAGHNKAIEEYSELINKPNASREFVLMSLVNRGIIYAELGKIDCALSDFATVIESPNIITEPLINALFNRSILYQDRGLPGDLEKSILDFTSIVESQSLSTEQLASALFNRGYTYSKLGQQVNLELEISDYSRVIALPGAPIEMRALSFLNRGISYSVRNKPNDKLLAIADFKAVIDMHDIKASIYETATCHLNKLLLNQ